MKIICVGLNYHSHNKEMNRTFSEQPENPVLFMKPDTALLSNDKNIFYIPDYSSDIQYEAEIVVKINKMGKNIAEKFAPRYYNEVTIGLDLTARDLQSELKKKGLPWEISKAFDNSAPLGKFVSIEHFAKSVSNLDFELIRNGSVAQSSNTSQMIHSVDKIVSYASQYFTLKTGDLIFTGTPAGVGSLHIGDVYEGRIEGETLLNLKIC